MDIKKIADKVIAHIEEEVENNRDQYIDDDGYVSINIESALETVLENEDLEVDDNTFESILNSINVKEVRDIESDLRDTLEDEEYYRRDPLGYHGLKQSDFI